MPIINNIGCWEQTTEHLVIPDSVTDRGIAFQTLAVHRLTNRNMDIDIVIDLYVLFAFIFAMQTSCILGNNAFPCYGQDKK